MRSGAITIGCGAVLTVLFVLPGSAAAANTWAGTWDTTLGTMTLKESGRGSYDGTSSGGSIGRINGAANGNVNEGTWTNDSTGESGPFAFELTESGQAFTGEYDFPEGGCAPGECRWDGACISGDCLFNSTAGNVTTEIEWEFALGDLPSRPRAKDLPKHIDGIDLSSRGASLIQRGANASFESGGRIRLRTSYAAGPAVTDAAARIELGPDGDYRKSSGEVAVATEGRVVRSDDPNCPDRAKVDFVLGAFKDDEGNKTVHLEMTQAPGDQGEDCLTDRRMAWSTKSFRTVKIGRPKEVAGRVVQRVN